MCHDAGSRPPRPPVTQDLDSSGSFELTAVDGNALAAYEAVPVGEPRSRVVILPDIRGLHPYYRALAERFAETGVYAVAIDYFGRTAGPALREEGFDWQQHLPAVTPESVRLDVQAAVRHLSPEGNHPVFSVGFCFGGGQSWRLAASDLDLAGAIGFYGRPALVDDVALGVRRPVLMLVAGQDQATPVGDSLALAQRLRDAGADVEVHVYEGAPHSFFDRAFDQHAAACKDAWERVLGFMDRHG